MSTTGIRVADADMCLYMDTGLSYSVQRAHCAVYRWTEPASSHGKISSDGRHNDHAGDEEVREHEEGGRAG